MKVDTAAPSIQRSSRKPAEIIQGAGLWHLPSDSLSWLLIAAGILAFSPLLEGGTTHIAVMAIRLMILALAGVAVHRVISGGRTLVSQQPLAIPILLFLVVASCSVVFSGYAHHSIHWLIALVSYAMFLYLLVFFMSRWEHVAILVGTFLAIASMEAVLSVVQFVRGTARPSGTFFNPNFLAGYLVAAWSVVLSYMSYYPIRHDLSRPRFRQGLTSFTGIVLPLSLFVALTMAIIGTGSRGGVFAACIGASIVVGARFGHRGLVIFLVLCLLGLTLIPNPLRERAYAEHAFNPVTYARWEMWESTLRMMMDHPLGIGLGLYQYVFPQYAFPVESQIARFGTLAQTPHNEYLQIAVELGVAGLVPLCWGLYRLARQIRSSLSQRLTRFQRQLLLGAAGAIGSLLAHAAVDSNLHEPALAIALTAFVSVIAAPAGLLAAQRERSPVTAVKYGPAWAIAATLVLGLLAVVVLRLGVAWLYYETGNELNRNDDLAGALQQYNAAVAMDPGKTLYHSAVAAVSFRQFERSEDLSAARTAVDHLSEATKLNPLDGRLAGLLGKIYLRLASVPSLEERKRRKALLLAELAYRDAIAKEPFNVVHYWEAGQVHIQLGDIEQGESLIKRVVDIEPNFLRAREWLSRSYLKHGEFSLAREEYREIRNRQDRYRDRPLTLLEKEFLTADTNALGAALAHAEGTR